ncbi:unnamed protein product [Peronospora destructor]|uniref:AGC-kinase C-terminal domain-containing protein n=1 Tax=Peronospora destructor TaxID=86335 RepID=A0AAV0V4Z4_9STRA|nr:unnamed protein product [Peronospora destructor]
MALPSVVSSPSTVASKADAKLLNGNNDWDCFRNGSYNGLKSVWMTANSRLTIFASSSCTLLSDTELDSIEEGLEHEKTVEKDLEEENAVYRDPTPSLVYDGVGSRQTAFSSSRSFSTRARPASIVLALRAWHPDTLHFLFSADRALLVCKISEEEPSFPNHFSPELCNLLSAVLHKDVNQRLGNGSNGIQDILDHPFFANINLHRLETKRVTPPIVRKLATKLDTSNFECQFTSQQVEGHLVYEERRP